VVWLAEGVTDTQTLMSEGQTVVWMPGASGFQSD
jgi:hypothetical protein